MNNKEIILNIINQRKITQLIHFTKKENISSILNNGLLSVEELKNKNLEYKYNDPERRDDWDFAISLSITNKNHLLFNNFKNRQNLKDSDFMEIKINPSVIIENECIFCDTNAANHTFEPYRKDPEKLNDLKIWPAFDGIFKDIVIRHYQNDNGKIRRISQKPNEPTCFQAEICLIGKILPENFINLNELEKLQNG